MKKFVLKVVSMALFVVMLFSLSGCASLDAWLRFFKFLDDPVSLTEIVESEYFIFTYGPNTKDELNLVGLTDEGKEQEYLVIPKTINGKEIVLVGCSWGLDLSVINKKYGEGNDYAQFQSEKLKKVFICSNIKVYQYNVTFVEPLLFENAPLFEGLFWITNDVDENEGGYHTSLTLNGNKTNSLALTANVSYYYNYENAPNNGYYWIDNYGYGSKIEYIPENPVREGYVFGGWYKEPECINIWNFDENKLPMAQYDENEKEVYQETKLYAKWLV